MLTVFISNGNLPTPRGQSCSLHYMKITSDYNAHNEQMALDGATSAAGWPTEGPGVGQHLRSMVGTETDREM